MYIRHHPTTDPVGRFKHNNTNTRIRQIKRAAQPCKPGTHNNNHRPAINNRRCQRTIHPYRPPSSNNSSSQPGAMRQSSPIVLDQHPNRPSAPPQHVTQRRIQLRVTIHKPRTFKLACPHRLISQQRLVGDPSKRRPRRPSRNTSPHRPTDHTTDRTRHLLSTHPTRRHNIHRPTNIPPNHSKHRRRRRVVNRYPTHTLPTRTDPTTHNTRPQHHRPNQLRQRTASRRQHNTEPQLHNPRAEQLARTPRLPLPISAQRRQKTTTNPAFLNKSVMISTTISRPIKPNSRRAHKHTRRRR